MIALDHAFNYTGWGGSVPTCPGDPPVHPLFGRDFEFVVHRHNWGEDRVYCRAEDGGLFFLPASWTDIVSEDPFAVIAAGRCPFTLDDLVGLAVWVPKRRPCVVTCGCRIRLRTARRGTPGWAIVLLRPSTGLVWTHNSNACSIPSASLELRTLVLRSMSLIENKAVVEEIDELGNGTGDISRLDAPLHAGPRQPRTRPEHARGPRGNPPIPRVSAP
jgi:hypothetical protein